MPVAQPTRKSLLWATTGIYVLIFICIGFGAIPLVYSPVYRCGKE
jgi:hypothetical protein